MTKMGATTTIKPQFNSLPLNIILINPSNRKGEITLNDLSIDLNTY